jgi:hypothetical protein
VDGSFLAHPCSLGFHTNGNRCDERVFGVAPAATCCGRTRSGRRCSLERPGELSQSPDMKPKKRRRLVSFSDPSASSNHCSASLDQNS